MKIYQLLIFTLILFSGLFFPQSKSVYLESSTGRTIKLVAAADDDGDGIDNVLEVNGFTYNPIDGLQQWDGDSTKKYYITDPLRWSTDGDPYSDYMEVTGVNMPAGVLAPENHPLVAARPIIRIGLEGYDVIPIGTITNTDGGETSNSFTNETTTENQVGVSVSAEVSFNPLKLASVTVEASYSHTWAHTESSTNTFGKNWSKTKSTNPSEAARLKLRMYMENIGSASALDVTPTFNLMIGRKTIATITPDQSANILSPKNTNNSRYPQTGTILVEKDQNNNDIILSLEELKSIQMGSPLSLVVVQVDANVIRWNTETQDWTSNISWTSFENEIVPVSVEVKAEFGTDQSKTYQVFAGTEYWNPRYTLKDILSNIFEVNEDENGTTIAGRNYPGDWYFSTPSDSVLNEWNKLGQPENLLSLRMFKNTKIAMMTPGGDPNPLLSLATFTPDFKKIYVSAFPNNFPIVSVKAQVIINNEVKQIPLTQGNGAFFTNADLFENSASPDGKVFVENARGDISETTIILPAVYSSAKEVKENSALLPNPGGDFFLFVDGDEEKPVQVYCMFFDPETEELLAEPREYLPLAKTFQNTGEPMKYNYSFIPATDSLDVIDYTYMYYGTDVVSYFEKVRINMNTLAIDPNDTTFVNSTGSLNLAEFTTWGGGYPVGSPFSKLSFGSGGNCYYDLNEGKLEPGFSNVNFEDTPFKIDTTNIKDIIGFFSTDPSGEQNIWEGYKDSSFIEFNYTEHTIDISGGGYWGFFGFTDSLRLIYKGLPKITDVEDGNYTTAVPVEYSLSQNYPNPFNPSTTIEFKIPETSQVSLKVYDITGREVAELVNEMKSSGNYKINFNASNFASGVYFYRLQAGNFSKVNKMILIK